MKEMINALLNWVKCFHDMLAVLIMEFAKLFEINKILLSVILSFISAYIFYLIIPYRKDRKRKRMIVNGYQQQYKFFKQDMICELLCICNDGADSELMEKLQNINEFRKYFRCSERNSSDNWHRAMNNSYKGLSEIIAITSRFLQATDVLIIAGIDFKNSADYQFFHNLRSDLFKLTHTNAEYDDVKYLFNYLWEIFAGYSRMVGYLDEDEIQKRINSI